MNGDLLVKTSDGTLYYAPAGTLRPVDDHAPGIAEVHRFMDANAGKAVGLHAAFCYFPGIVGIQAGDGWMSAAAKASTKPGAG